VLEFSSPWAAKLIVGRDQYGVSFSQVFDLWRPFSVFSGFFLVFCLCLFSARLWGFLCLLFWIVCFWQFCVLGPLDFLLSFLYNMKILPWNCRGLAQSSTIRSLRALIRKNNPDIIFLSKTKTASSTASSLLLQLGYSMNVQAPPSGSRGGLFLA